MTTYDVIMTRRLIITQQKVVRLKANDEKSAQDEGEKRTQAGDARRYKRKWKTLAADLEDLTTNAMVKET